MRVRNGLRLCTACGYRRSYRALHQYFPGKILALLMPEYSVYHNAATAGSLVLALLQINPLLLGPRLATTIVSQIVTSYKYKNSFPVEELCPRMA